jgi:hypothetical protein
VKTAASKNMVKVVLCPCSTPFCARMISRHDAQLCVK